MRIFIVFSSILLSALSLQAQTSKQRFSTYTFKLAHEDTYLFRGHVYSAEPTATGEFGMGRGQWSYDLFYAKPGESVFNSFEEEYNHSVSYTTLQGKRVMTSGYRMYDYGSGSAIPDTQEFFSRMTFLTKWRPTWGIAMDIDSYRGWYADYSISREYPISRRFKTEFGIDGGLALELDEKEKSDDDGNPLGEILEPGFFDGDGFTHAAAKFKIVWTPTRWLSLETGIKYNYAFDDLLYSELVERDQTVWRSALTIKLP